MPPRSRQHWCRAGPVGRGGEEPVVEQRQPAGLAKPYPGSGFCAGIHQPGQEPGAEPGRAGDSGAGQPVGPAGHPVVPVSRETIPRAGSLAIGARQEGRRRQSAAPLFFCLYGLRAAPRLLSGPFQCAERWPSGRRRTPGKCVWVKSSSRVRIPPAPPLPCREPAIGPPQGRKAPSNLAIFRMPSEPRRLADAVKAVSERNLSLITRTSPPVVRI